MSDRARKTSEKSTSSSSSRRTNPASRQSSSAAASSQSASKVPKRATNTDIAEQIGFWSSQSFKSDNSPLTTEKVTSKEDFGKPRRLYSQIDKATQGNNFIIRTLDHKFPIKEIFLVKSAETQSVTLPNGSSHTLNSGVMHIKAGDLTLSRRTASGETSAVIQQEATFNITTGEIELRLKQDSAGLLYQSRYKVHGLFTPEAQIKLNPFTTEQTKLIQPVRRTKTYLAKLNKRVVNIYSYLNSKATRSPNVNFNSTLAELKAKLGELTKHITDLESMTIKSSEQKEEIAQYKFVESVLANEESLANYKRDLTRWYENYKSWSNKPELIALNIENHQYIMEFKKVGKSRLSKYMENLVARTMQYDPRISMTEDTEIVTDYTQMETAERKHREDKEKAARIKANLDKAKARNTNNQSEIASLTAELQQAVDKAKVSVMDRMKRTDTIKSASGFGLYPPYLLSDMLRYGSIFMKTSIIDALALSSENIGNFAGYVNGFKSLVFNIVSLYNQLVSHKLSNAHLCTDALDDTVADIIINVTYHSNLYPQLGWLFTPISGVVPTYNTTPVISQPFRFTPCMGVEKSLNILAEIKPEYKRPVDLLLLRVDEPLFGEHQFTGGILDFDLIYADRFKSVGILGALASMVSDPLSENFRRLLEFRYDYSEDILVSAEVVQGEFKDEDFPEFINAEPTQEMVASIDLWSGLDKSVLASSSDSELSPIQRPQPVFVQTKTKQTKEKVVDDIIGISQTEDDAGFQDWTPLILTKSSAASSESQRELEIPIKQITRAGKVILADTFSHNYSNGDTVQFFDLEGTYPNELKKSKWIIDIEEEVTRGEDGIKNIVINRNQFFIRDFYLPSEIPAPVITSGKVRRVPDMFLEPHKKVRDTGKDARDAHVMSQTQWRKAQEEYNAKQAVKKYGFSNLEQYNIEKNRAVMNALNTKIMTIASKTEPFKKQLLRGVLSDEILFNMIQALKDSNPEDVFLVLEIDEIVKILKFKLLHPDDNRNVRELFRIPEELGLRRDFTPLHDRTISTSRGTVNGFIENAVEEWHNTLTGVRTGPDSGKRSDRDSGKSSGKGKGSGKGKYKEKYLKYKTKYLELKAQLGL